MTKNMPLGKPVSEKSETHNFLYHIGDQTGHKVYIVMAFLHIFYHNLRSTSARRFIQKLY